MIIYQFSSLTPTTETATTPKIPIIVLTRLTNPFLLELAVKNGAVAALCKNTTSGDVLDKTILRAVSTVPMDRKKETSRTSITQLLLP